MNLTFISLFFPKGSEKFTEFLEPQKFLISRGFSQNTKKSKIFGVLEIRDFHEALYRNLAKLKLTLILKKIFYI